MRKYFGELAPGEGFSDIDLETLMGFYGQFDQGTLLLMMNEKKFSFADNEPVEIAINRAKCVLGLQIIAEECELSCEAEYPNVFERLDPERHDLVEFCAEATQLIEAMEVHYYDRAKLAQIVLSDICFQGSETPTLTDVEQQALDDYQSCDAFFNYLASLRVSLGLEKQKAFLLPLPHALKVRLARVESDEALADRGVTPFAQYRKD